MIKKLMAPQVAFAKERWDKGYKTMYIVLLIMMILPCIAWTALGPLLISIIIPLAAPLMILMYPLFIVLSILILMYVPLRITNKQVLYDDKEKAYYDYRYITKRGLKTKVTYVRREKLH